MSEVPGITLVCKHDTGYHTFWQVLVSCCTHPFSPAKDTASDSVKHTLSLALYLMYSYSYMQQAVRTHDTEHVDVLAICVADFTASTCWCWREEPEYSFCFAVHTYRV